MSSTPHSSTNPWLSPRRNTIAALRAELGPYPNLRRHQAEMASLESTLRALKEDLRLIRVAAIYDTGLLTAIGRKARARKREQERGEIQVEIARYRAALHAEDERIHADWTQWWDAHNAITRQVELAAAEEFALRHHGKRAPWLELTLGPIPPADRRDLAQRWFAVAEYVNRLRVERDITDAAVSGLSNDDSPLANDIRTLRWHTKQAIEQTPLARRFDPMEGAYRPGRIGLPGIPFRQD